jgi:ribosome-associated protein
MVCSAAMTASKVSRPPARAALVKTVVAALDDMKATNVKVMDVRKVTDVSDCMVLASGNSDRHVRSIADRVVERAKAAGFRPMGMEGERDAEWVLVDLNDVIVHVMLPRVREFYGLEELWEPVPAKSKAKPVKAKPKAKTKSRDARKPGATKKPGAARGKPKGKASAASRPRKPAAAARGKKSSSRVSSRSRG